jgi:hypothetical protein
MDEKGPILNFMIVRHSYTEILIYPCFSLGIYSILNMIDNSKFYILQ